MSATSAPFGMRPSFHPSGLDRATAFQGGIESGYASTILKGQPVKLDSATGFIVVAAAGDSLLGIFDGVEYTDSLGKRTESNKWPASTVGTDNVAYIWIDPVTIWDIQANGSLAQAAIGDMADFASITAGSSVTGLSQCMISTTLVGAGNSAQLQIVNLTPAVDNAWGDAFTVVQVRMNEMIFQAPNNAI